MGYKTIFVKVFSATLIFNVDNINLVHFLILMRELTLKSCQRSDWWLDFHRKQMLRVQKCCLLKHVLYRELNHCWLWLGVKVCAKLTERSFIKPVSSQAVCTRLVISAEMLVIAQSETNKKECQDKGPVIFTLCFYHCRETTLTKDPLQLQETSRMFWGIFTVSSRETLTWLKLNSSLVFDMVKASIFHCSPLLKRYPVSLLW